MAEPKQHPRHTKREAAPKPAAPEPKEAAPKPTAPEPKEAAPKPAPKPASPKHATAELDKKYKYYTTFCHGIGYKEDGGYESSRTIYNTLQEAKEGIKSLVRQVGQGGYINLPANNSGKRWYSWEIEIMQGGKRLDPCIANSEGFRDKRFDWKGI